MHAPPTFSKAVILTLTLPGFNHGQLIFGENRSDFLCDVQLQCAYFRLHCLKGLFMQRHALLIDCLQDFQQLSRLIITQIQQLGHVCDARLGIGSAVMRPPVDSVATVALAILGNQMILPMVDVTLFENFPGYAHTGLPRLASASASAS